ncbi:MAG: lyase family protein [Burkholderiaceae bacterium]
MTDTLRGQFASDTVSRHFEDAALLTAMARVEAALAAAQADAGQLDRSVADRIEAVCVRRFGVAASVAGAPPGASHSTTRRGPGTPKPAEENDPFSPATLAAAARRAGTLAIPFVKALTEAVAAEDPQAARWLHRGATSQDVADTALALAVSAAGRELRAQVARTGDALARLADAHRGTMLVGRTLLQPATPVPFGWKAACWLAPVTASYTGLVRALHDAGALQLGGASGIRAALGGHGTKVAAAMAARLGLVDPGTSWHGSRDRIARLGAELALATGAMARIGRDLSLLMQGEVGETFEPTGEGRGGSSAMPHKRNPVAAMLAIQAGLRAPGLAATLLAQLPGEHERGLGTWQADWWTLGALFECAGSATEAMGEAIEGLRVDQDAMRENLERTRGFVFAEAVTVVLSDALGKPAAQAAMERLCREAIERGEPLRDALLRERSADAALAAALPDARIDALFDAGTQRGDADAMIDRAIADWRAAASLALR